jgi:chromosome segregation ATPase
MEYQIKLTQQLGKIEEKLDKISQSNHDLEQKINKQNERLENLEMFLLERSQAIIERQNDCLGLLESPGIRHRYALSEHSQDYESLSNYSDSGFSQSSEPSSEVFGHHYH